VAQRRSEKLKTYGRFLEPILATMVKKEMNPAQARRLQDYLNFVCGQLVAQNLRRN
jgi:hypothetical protein